MAPDRKARVISTSDDIDELPWGAWLDATAARAQCRDRSIDSANDLSIDSSNDLPAN
jgi:hypothetical protein